MKTVASLNRRVVFASCLVALGCGGDDIRSSEMTSDAAVAGLDAAVSDAAVSDAMVPEPPFPFVRCENPGDPLPALVEDRSVYDQDTLEVPEIRLTVTDLEAFALVNADDDPHVPKHTVPVLFQEGSFGEGLTAPNGTLKARGHASLGSAQQNYKVKLTSKTTLWNGQREINLNKHMGDRTRVRNKTAFDILQTVPHLTSARTRFVHVFINDDDYGLFTWIEELDKRFLRSHGLDTDGQLYKTAHWHFEPIDPAIVADYNPTNYYDSMDYYVEDKANEDRAKLMRMVDALDNEDLKVDTIIDTYFNRENLITWLAVNVLVNNLDTVTQNFYLYSPSSCEGWYILPWDYDGAFDFYTRGGRESSLDRWRSGLSNWWRSRLFRRFFTVPANVEAIETRILELQEGVLNDAIVDEKFASYHDIVEAYISAEPDITHLPGHDDEDGPAAAIAVWNAELSRITTTVTKFSAEFFEVIERPMPVFMSFTLQSPLKFRWNNSYDLQQDPITYDFQISTTTLFEAGDIVEEQLGLTDRTTTVPSLPAGTYYWRVFILDNVSATSYQLPYDPYEEIVIP